MDHGHEHGCGCGHHHEGEGGGHDHGHEGCGCPLHQGLSEEQTSMLRMFAEYGRVPAANFVMGSSASPHCQAVALSPVLLNRKSDTLQEVKERCALVNELMSRHLVMYREDVTVCEHIAQAYRESEVFQYFEDTVKEGSAMPGFLFDKALLQMGCVAMTELGERALEA